MKIPARYSIAVLLIVLFSILYFGARTRNLIAKGAEWKITGKFALQGVYPSTKFDAGLAAIDQETGTGGWLGISSPRAINWAGLLREQLPALSVLLIYPLNLGLFLLPGLAITVAISARRKIWVVHAVILSIASSAALGYAAFWVFFESKLLGKTFSFASIAISALSLAVLLTGSPRLRRLCREMAAPFLYLLIVGMCYLCCLFFVVRNPFTSGASLANVRFFSERRPGDNLIPLILAERIYDRRPVEPFCCGDWLSSDRPPLQAGILLSQRPFKIWGNIGFNYQLLGTALNCLWICGVWSFLKTMRAPQHRIKQVLGFLIFSGFLFYNSVYVWPKLLAATFILFFLSILFKILEDDRPITSFETTLATLSFSLAVMAHPGSIFSLPAFLVILISKRRLLLLSLRQCVLAAMLIAIFVAPWMAYQRFYDPPGNRLLKMHLAGVIDIDSRSTWQAIKDAYTSRDARTYLRNKWANISILMGPKPIDAFGLAAFHSFHGMRLDGQISEASRIAQREYIWHAIGLLNAGWFAALLLLLRRKQKQALRHSGLLILAPATNLIIWCLVMFGPFGTFTTESSYADILLLSIGLSSFLLVLHPIIIILLLVLQILNFFVVWVLPPPSVLNLQEDTGIQAMFQLPLFILGLGCALGLAWHFGRSYFERDAVTS